MIEIKKISVESTYPIRLDVLRKEINLPFKFNGDLDEETFHLGAFKNGELIAVSSFMKVANINFEGSQYQLRGMATLESAQGIGAGRLMLIEAVSILKKKTINCLWCNARVVAVDFYKKQEFKVFGAEFDVKHIGNHYVMFKYL